MNTNRIASNLAQPKLGEQFCHSGVISPEQLDQALLLQKQHGGRIGEILSALGFISTTSLVLALQEMHGVRALDLTTLEIPFRALTLLPMEKMELHQVVPLEVNDKGVYLAMADPSDLNALKELEFQLGRNIQPIAAPSSQIKAVLRSLKENSITSDQPLKVRDFCISPPQSGSIQKRNYPPNKGRGSCDLICHTSAVG